ncbi:MAG: hypothetical protein ACUVX8_05470, partial [Candidatus Zipacnadales bacterium]
APNVPAPILQPLARRAGGHLYVETLDAVWSTGSLVSLYATSAGERRLRLPYQAIVRDVLTGELIGTQVAEFTITMTEGQTRLFSLQPAPQ